MASRPVLAAGYFLGKTVEIPARVVVLISSVRGVVVCEAHKLRGNEPAHAVRTGNHL